MEQSDIIIKSMIIGSLTLIIDIFQLGLTKSTFYVVNGIILVLLFLLIRILNYPIAILVYTAQYHNWNIWSALSALYPMCHILSALQSSLQAFWFYQIVTIGGSALLHKKGS